MSPSADDCEQLLRDAVLGPEDVVPPNKRSRPRLERSPVLRLAANNVVLTERQQQPLPRKVRSTIEGNFSYITSDHLTDPAWWPEIPPRLRLYLLVQYRTKRSETAIRLSNEMAAAIGLSRQNKHRCLNELGARNLIGVTHRGQCNPEVSLILPVRIERPPEA